jgi:hypothetical protein
MTFGKNIASQMIFEDDYQRLKPLILEQNIPPFNPIFNLGALAMKH